MEPIVQAQGRVKRLVLVGGGHAHLEVLRAAARRPFRDTELVLVSPFPRHHYSSMVPAFLRGAHDERALSFDLAALCRLAGARFVEGWAERVNGAGRVVETTAAALEFGAASLDVGAEPAGLDVPGAREHAVAVRPMSQAVALRARVEALAAAGGGAVCVVGGGAAGAEVAWSIGRRLGGRGPMPPITLVEREAVLLPEYGTAVRRRVGALLAARGIAVRTGQQVVRVATDAVTLADGTTLASALTVWLTGAAPPAVVVRSPLAKDARGFVSVDATLREAGGLPVWGAGDCVTPRDHPATPKAGVYAVRAAPVLAANLRTAATGAGGVRRWTPQPHFLALLDTADGRALLRWHGVVSHSRAAWRLKRWIDARFMRRYQALYAGG